MMILLEEVTTEAQIYDAITFLNRFWFQALEFVVILALVVVAVILGAKLRKVTDACKAKKEAAKENIQESSADDITKEEKAD